jgi:hypothetical protein
VKISELKAQLEKVETMYGDIDVTYRIENEYGLSSYVSHCEGVVGIDECNNYLGIIYNNPVKNGISCDEGNKLVAVLGAFCYENK